MVILESTDVPITDASVTCSWLYTGLAQSHHAYEVINSVIYICPTPYVTSMTAVLGSASEKSTNYIAPIMQLITSRASLFMPFEGRSLTALCTCS